MHKMVQDFEKLIRERLKPSRYQHSLNVANEAAKLAKLYGADEDKAYICGILHDVMKNASPDEQLSLINESGRKLSDLEMSNQKLWHAIAGAAYLEKTLKIDDDEMVEAVCCHTTAKPNMTMLQKIIYIADYISEDRDYEGVDEMRKKAYQDINSAVLTGTQFSIIDLANKCRAIHPNTVAAYNEMCSKA
ncbi:MAG: bis(5'-nucleosyl)-tetraphosphatase (symmetrical) YqeK [Oscillospiraceae bacterium]